MLSVTRSPRVDSQGLSLLNSLGQARVRWEVVVAVVVVTVEVIMEFTMVVTIYVTVEVY